MTGLNILFIDDDSFMLKALLRTARRLKPDWQFYLSDDAAAWQVTLPTGLIPDAVFCDFLMPHKNGDVVLEEVEGLFPSAVRILLTGDTAEDVVSRASEVAHFVLSKPFSEDDLNHVFSCLVRLNFLDFNFELRNRLGCNHYFDVLPELAAKIRRLFSQQDVNISVVAEVISHETLIAAKLIQLANSAFLGYIKHTASLEESIKRLGLKLTEAIVISMSIEHTMSRKVQPAVHQRFSEWAVKYAQTCRSNSKLLGFNNEMQDLIFAAALFTGVGHLALAAESPNYSPPLVDFDKGIMFERATLISVYMLTLWGFSAELCDIILYQDKPDFSAQGLDGNMLSLIMFVTKLKIAGQLNTETMVRVSTQIQGKKMTKLLNMM